MNDIISPLTPVERERENYLKQRIIDGLSVSKNGYDILVPALIEIFEKRLYREDGDINIWAQKNFGMTSRTIYYYLEMGGVTQNIKQALPDADLSNLALRHSIALAEYTPESQPIIWEEVSKGETVTEKKIRKIAADLESIGQVQRKNEAVEEDERIRARAIKVILKEWKNLDSTGIVQAMTAVIESSSDLEIALIQSVVESYTNETSNSDSNKGI